MVRSRSPNRQAFGLISACRRRPLEETAARKRDKPISPVIPHRMIIDERSDCRTAASVFPLQALALFSRRSVACFAAHCRMYCTVHNFRAIENVKSKLVDATSLLNSLTRDTAKADVYCPIIVGAPSQIDLIRA